MALIVRPSQLTGAGLGLFTTRSFRKDSKIIEYRGEIIGSREYRRRAQKQEDHYLFYVKKGRCIDAMHTPQYKARYANDAAGMKRVKGLRNNSDYVIFGLRCYIVASRDIRAGEEIFVNYTKPYWDCMKRRAARKKASKK